MSLGTRCYKGQHQHKQGGSLCHDVPSGVRKVVRVSAELTFLHNSQCN